MLALVADRRAPGHVALHEVPDPDPGPAQALVAALLERRVRGKAVLRVE